MDKSLKLRHRNATGTDHNFPIDERTGGGVFTLIWNCNRFEGLVGTSMVFLAKSEDTFKVANGAVTNPNDLPIEIAPTVR